MELSMKTNQGKKLLSKIRFLIIVFIIGLILSGITAFPIETQLSVAVKNQSVFPEFIRNWLNTVYFAVKSTNVNFPFISYGTDWLAFAHIVIAIAFIGPLKDPVKNVWVIQFGMIACLLIFPLALIAGYIREIPLYWRLLDCLFGVFGFIPLFICYRSIKKFEELKQYK
jgi:hypothetical protein